MDKTKSEKKREKLTEKKSSIQQRIADLEEMKRKLKEEERETEKKIAETENQRIVEIVNSYNVSSAELPALLSNGIMLRDNPSQGGTGTTPAYKTEAVMGTATHKTAESSAYEKEKDYDDQEH